MEATGSQQVYCKYLDLSSLACVSKFSQGILLEEPRLDILVNNAGVTGTYRKYILS